MIAELCRLVLGRRAGEGIVLDLPDGRQVKVKTSRCTSLTIEAPRDVKVRRSELIEVV